jgi:AbrB family looped-hinge helix DNA binding protein
MDTVTLSPQFQLEIPPAVREELGLQPGEKFQLTSNGGRLEFTPLRQPSPPRRPIQEMRGLLRGMKVDPDIEADEDRL